MNKKNSSLGHTPSSEKWLFDEKTTDCFEDMLKRSIPQYEIMRKLVNDLTLNYHIINTHILDLGSSRGDSIDKLIELKKDAYFDLSEVSPPMIEVLKRKYSENKRVTIHEIDLRKNFPYCMASVTLSILTLQFTPIEYRQEIIQKVYDNLYPNGVFILVEKVLGENSSLNKIFVEKYHDLKKENGYTQEEIDRKKLSLEGVLVPVTANWNKELLTQAGFRQIDTFWRYLNFCGIIAIK